MINLIFCIIIVAILLVISIIHVTKNNIYDELISGFYNGDYDFCEESGIDVFCLYIGDDVDYRNRRSGYILMQSGDDLLMNEPITVKISRQWSISSDPCKPKFYDIEFTDMDEENDFFPSCQIMRFYPNTGKIVLYSDDTVFGVLYKSGYESEVKMIEDSKKNDDDDFNDDDLE